MPDTPLWRVDPTSRRFRGRPLTGTQPGAGENPVPVEPTVPPGTTGAAGGAGGVPTTATEAILKDFTNALATYIGRGFGGNVANWLRQNQDLLSQRFLERFMSTQTGNEVSGYSPMDFFATFNPFLAYYMTRPEERGVYRYPGIAVKRLNI